MERQSGWKRRSKEEIEDIFAFSEEYKRFLNKAKTEREAVEDVERALKEQRLHPGPEKHRRFIASTEAKRSSLSKGHAGT